MLWRLMSSTKTPWPWSRRRSSLRGMLWPCHGFGPAGASSSTRSGATTVSLTVPAPGTGKAGTSALWSLRRVHGSCRDLLARRGPDRVDDVPVAGAAAAVAPEALADLVVGRPRIALEQGGRGDQHAGRAVAALEGVVVGERPLQRRQLVARGEALDRADARAVGLDGEQHAALHELPVEQDAARAAVARVAADVAAGQVDVVAQKMDQQSAGLDLALMGDAVHLHGNAAARVDRSH